ncbi:hypothetical protein M413DRAFT_48960, partial [Hebeloma cylindrosporum]
FLLATKEILKSKTPLIHQVIPIFDIITTALEDSIDNNSLPSVVRHAALRGYLMLNKYYSLTDESVVYRIAMILHPRYKTSYFVRAKWPQQWSTDAETLARKVWTAKYKKEISQPVTQTKATNDRFSAARKYFDVLQETGTPIDPLEEWLSSPVVNTQQDPITYWTGMQAAGHPLAMMALDFMSIPATSTDVERAFLHGGLTISKIRHSLSDKSARAATVLGSWSSLEGVIPKAHIIQLFKDKSKR